MLEVIGVINVLKFLEKYFYFLDVDLGKCCINLDRENCSFNWIVNVLDV